MCGDAHGSGVGKRSLQELGSRLGELVYGAVPTWNDEEEVEEDADSGVVLGTAVEPGSDRTRICWLVPREAGGVAAMLPVCA